MAGMQGVQFLKKRATVTKHAGGKGAKGQRKTRRGKGRHGGKGAMGARQEGVTRMRVRHRGWKSTVVVGLVVTSVAALVAVVLHSCRGRHDVLLLRRQVLKISFQHASSFSEPSQVVGKSTSIVIIIIARTRTRTCICKDTCKATAVLRRRALEHEHGAGFVV